MYYGYSATTENIFLLLNSYRINRMYSGIFLYEHDIYCEVVNYYISCSLTVEIYITFYIYHNAIIKDFQFQQLPKPFCVAFENSVSSMTVN